MLPLPIRLLSWLIAAEAYVSLPEFAPFVYMDTEFFATTKRERASKSSQTDLFVSRTKSHVFFESCP